MRNKTDHLPGTIDEVKWQVFCFVNLTELSEDE